MKISGFSRTISRVIAPLACVLVLANSACGKDDSDSATSSADLVGTWTSGCVASEGSSKNYSMSTYVFTVTMLKTTTMSYTKAGCATNDISEVFEGETTYKTDGGKIDYTATSLTATPKTDAAVKSYQGICPTLTWKKGTLTNLKTCDVFKDLYSPIYSIFKIEGNKLTTGKESEGKDGSNDAKRHSEYDTSQALTKQ